MQQYSVYATYKMPSTAVAIHFDGSKFVCMDTGYCLSKTVLQDKSSSFRCRLVKNARTQLFEYSRSVSFSSEFDCAISIGKSSRVNIIGLAHHPPRNRYAFDLCTAPITATMFSHSAGYFAVGSEDGECGLFELCPDAPRLLMQFEKMGDSISAIAFSPDEKLIAVSSYSKTTSVYEVGNGELFFSFETKSVIKKLLFIVAESGRKEIVYICRDGYVGIYCASTQRFLQEIQIDDCWPSDMLFLNNDTLLVSSRQGRLAICPIDDLCVSREIDFEKGGITKLCMADAKLFVCFCGGELLVIDTHLRINEFLLLVGAQRIEDAYSICEENLFLCFEPSFKKALLSGWRSKIEEITRSIADGNMKRAFEIAKPYLGVRSLALEFEAMSSNMAEIAEFICEFEKQNYSAAYAVAYADETGTVQKLPTFEALERLFDEAVLKAILTVEGVGFVEKQTIYNILKPFIGIPSKKNTIDALNRSLENYERAFYLYRSKNFRDFFLLCDKFRFLRECTIYKKANSLGNSIYANIANLEASKEFEKALQLSRLLCDFLPHKENALQKINELSKKISFLELMEGYKNGYVNMHEIFDAVAREPLLESFYVFEEFLKEIYADIEQVNECCKSNIDKFLESIYEYLAIPYLKVFIENLCGIKLPYGEEAEVF